MKFLGTLLIIVALCLGILWASGAIYYDLPIPKGRGLLALLFGMVAGTLVIRRGPLARGIVGVLLLGIAGWWLSISPQQWRHWKPEVAVTPRAWVTGERVTVEGVRNFDYRTELDFTPRYETRTYDLRNLRGVDCFVNYWGSPIMAHPIMSFDFGRDGRVCFSIETRMEQGESYSALGGLYRQCELIYVVADERDVIRVRTNYRRGEDVYLYHLNAPRMRESFLEYIAAVNALHETPRWYHVLTNNCTSAIRQQRATERRSPWDWRMLVNGYGDELMYERGAIDRSLPFAELKKLSHINERAIAADAAPDFSERIREGLPGGH